MSAETMKHAQDIAPVVPDETANGASLWTGDGDVGDDAHEVGAVETDDVSLHQGDGVITDNGARPPTRSSSARPRRQRRCETGSAGASAVSGPWLNADQAAEHMALSSRKALYELVRAGRVPYYRFGHGLRFRREELDEVIAAGRMRPAVYERRKKEVEVEGAPCADQGEGYDRADARLQQKGGK